MASLEDSLDRERQILVLGVDGMCVLRKHKKRILSWARMLQKTT